jgi:hypothetical protein
MADVTSSAENKGTAMKKVADLFVRLGQRGIISRYPDDRNAPPPNMRKNFGNIRPRNAAPAATTH